MLKFICQVFAQSTSLFRSSCNSRKSSGCLDRVLCHQQILIFCWLCHCLGHWCRWGKAVCPEYFLVVHMMSLVSSCWRFGWCKPFGVVLLISSGSIGLHYLGCHVPWPLRRAFHVVPCQMLFESPGRWSCDPCRRCQWHGQRSQAGLLGVWLSLKVCDHLTFN